MRIRTRSTLPLLVAGLLVGVLPGRGGARADGPTAISWVTSLKEAYARAKAQDKPIMIAINSRQVDGRAREEPAAKELREKTYKDPRVVELSQRFVCAFLTAEGSSADFGELRLRYGIDGDIVSPQHIFAYPDGKQIMRKEYWPFGYGEQAVEALLKMMNEALSKDQQRRTPSAPGAKPPGPGEGGDSTLHGAPPPAPPEGEAREKWIVEQLGHAVGTSEDERRPSLAALVAADKDGDVLPRVIALLEQEKKRTDVLVDVARALGRPGLNAAVGPLIDLLGHKEPAVRANAAVSLEYVGSPDAVSGLMRRAPHEDDEMIANHLYRALGRCGAGEGKVRAALVKRVQGSKTEEGTYGAIIGLAYFEKDPRTAREVEKLLKKVGVPGGGRGGRGAWRSGLKRSLLTWCLTEVAFGDPKAATFIREELIPLVGESRWSKGILDFYKAAAQTCDGDKSAQDGVIRGVRFSVGAQGGRGEGNPLSDDARLGRDGTGFTPKGDEFGGG